MDKGGEYRSEIVNNNLRFTRMIAQLISGRVGVAIQANNCVKMALGIAVKYALSRRQFGPDNAAETLLMDYTTHQLRLLPILAKTYGLQLAFNELKEASFLKIGKEGKHFLSSTNVFVVIFIIFWND